MKGGALSVVCCVALAGVQTAFGFLPVATPYRARGRVEMQSQSSQESSRRQVLQQALGLAGVLGLASFSLPASAGWLGTPSPEVIDPKDAVIDKEILASEEVQSNIKSLKVYRDLVTSIKKDLAANEQCDLAPVVRKEFDPAKLRNILNKVNSVFDEDTQRGTDRLVRIILQDIAELETNSKLKPGTPRSARKLVVIQKKLLKLETAFNDLLSFF